MDASDPRAGEFPRAAAADPVVGSPSTGSARLRGRRRKTWLVVGGVVASVGAVALYLASQPRVIGGRSVPFRDLPAARGPSVAWFALGDTGEESGQQRGVAAAMDRVADRSQLEFVVLLGDNFYPRGVETADDPAWKRSFSDVYVGEALSVPFYALLGNHDYGGDPDAQVNWRGDERWRMPARYYSLDVPISEGVSAQLLMLDTTQLGRGGAEAAEQLEWIEDELRASEARWKVVCGHHTIHSGGKHSEELWMHELLEPLLVRHSVDLYVSGHDHHMGLMQPECGPPMIISGAGSKWRHVWWTEDTVWAGAGPGFVRVRMEPDSLWIVFHGGDGSVLYTHQLPTPAASS